MQQEHQTPQNNGKASPGTTASLYDGVLERMHKIRSTEGSDQQKHDYTKKKKEKKKKVTAPVCTKQRNHDLMGIVFLAHV